jgi:TPR repeat protein
MSEQWLQRYQQLSANGDPDAQIALAWEYVKGKIVRNDFDQAVVLFRQAELVKPYAARFNLAKAKLLNGDISFRHDLADDCKRGFGPALYLMGIAENRGLFGESNLDEALRYYALASENGHLISRFLEWRLKRLSISQRLATGISAIVLLITTFSILVRDPNDLRVLN